ncbi:MAG: hypothetical protein IIB07_07745 [Bacteroidetes bacterium]|nr:hypothetical protein [Bacteroidota bacterium]
MIEQQNMVVEDAKVKARKELRAERGQGDKNIREIRIEENLFQDIPRQYYDEVDKLQTLITSAGDIVLIAENGINNREHASLRITIFDAVKDKDSYLPTPEETEQIAGYVQMVDEIVKARNKQATLAVSLRSAVLRGATDEVSSLTESLQQAIEKQDENWEKLEGITVLADVLKDEERKKTFSGHAPIIQKLYDDGVITFT